jgi:CheY-like chemotaxis protein
LIVEMVKKLVGRDITISRDGKSVHVDASQLRAKKILWVDDSHQMFNHWLIGTLRSRSLGATLHLAGTTEEAMTLLQQQHYDTIISDTIRGNDQEAAITLFDHLPRANQQARKIINIGQDGLKKYEGPLQQQHRIDAVVANDLDLLEAIQGRPT